jgi:hypothetical protein
LHSGYNKVEKTKVASNINYLFSEVWLLWNPCDFYDW